MRLFKFRKAVFDITCCVLLYYLTFKREICKILAPQIAMGIGILNLIQYPIKKSLPTSEDITPLLLNTQHHVKCIYKSTAPTSHAVPNFSPLISRNLLASNYILTP